MTESSPLSAELSEETLKDWQKDWELQYHYGENKQAHEFAKRGLLLGNEVVILTAALRRSQEKLGEMQKRIDNLVRFKEAQDKLDEYDRAEIRERGEE